MQAKTLLLGALAEISLSVLSLTLVPALACAKAPVVQPPMIQQRGYAPSLIMDNGFVYIVQNGVAYKINKL